MPGSVFLFSQDGGGGRGIWTGAGRIDKSSVSPLGTHNTLVFDSEKNTDKQ